MHTHTQHTQIIPSTDATDAIGDRLLEGPGTGSVGSKPTEEGRRHTGGEGQRQGTDILVQILINPAGTHTRTHTHTHTHRRPQKAPLEKQIVEGQREGTE